MRVSREVLDIDAMQSCGHAGRGPTGLLDDAALLELDNDPAEHGLHPRKASW